MKYALMSVGFQVIILEKTKKHLISIVCVQQSGQQIIRINVPFTCSINKIRKMTCKIKDRNRNNIVVIVTTIRTGPNGAPSLAGKKIFLFYKMCISALGPSPLPICWVPRAFSGCKMAGACN
jgi:hypothetical protein